MKPWYSAKGLARPSEAQGLEAPTRTGFCTYHRGTLIPRTPWNPLARTGVRTTTTTRVQIMAERRFDWFPFHRMLIPSPSPDYGSPNRNKRCLETQSLRFSMHPTERFPLLLRSEHAAPFHRSLGNVPRGNARNRFQPSQNRSHRRKHVPFIYGRKSSEQPSPSRVISELTLSALAKQRAMS